MSAAISHNLQVLYICDISQIEHTCNGCELSHNYFILGSIPCSAIDDFNNSVVLTNRQLKSDELFEVQLDQLVDKWAGSIEIGVTTHSPQDLEFPSTMTNIQSGTWMMTGNGVMHNGMTILEDYGQNLDRLRVRVTLVFEKRLKKLMKII